VEKHVALRAKICKFKKGVAIFLNPCAKVCTKCRIFISITILAIM
jgi:hypothetical protein